MFVCHKNVLNTCRIVVADRDRMDFRICYLLIGVGEFAPVFANGLLVVLYLLLPMNYCYDFI